MKLFTIPLLLIAAFCSLTWGTLAVGGQPEPFNVQTLHLADCVLPCWANITPGVTSSSEVEARINALFPDFQRGVGGGARLVWSETDGLDGIRTVILITLNQGVVSDIGIGIDHRRAEMPNLGELLAVFGTPTCIAVDQRSAYSSLFYEDAAHHLILQFSVHPPALSSSVNNFIFGTPDNASCQTRLAMSWRDFRASQRTLLRLS